MKKMIIRKNYKFLVYLFVLLIVMTGCGADESKSTAELTPVDDSASAMESAISVDNTNPAEEPAPIENSVPRLQFSHDSGVYPEETLIVTITAPEGYSVAYRTDGTMPTSEDDSASEVVEVKLKKSTARYLIENRKLQIMKDFSHSELHDDPDLPAGAILSAALINGHGEVGEPETKVYFLGLDFKQLFPNCLVLSVITDPDNLLNYDKGILATGAIYNEWRETKEGQKVIADQEWWFAESNSTQHGREWERPCIIQIYDEESVPIVEQKAGIRVQGALARRANQKSFNFYFRSDYGSKRLCYELFPGIREYKSISLRSGGNNSEYLKFKDNMLQELVSDRAVTTASFRPAILFLNGEYWGPYMITEKVSAQMIHDHYDVEEDQVVVIKEGKVEVGEDDDLLLYEELLSYADKDLTKPETYEQFCSIMDIKSFADFCAIRVYIGDSDWFDTDRHKQKNIILWRTRDTSFNNGRWQYILHDIEYSSGLYSIANTAPTTDHFQKAIEQTPLFAAAIQNDEFYELFLNSLIEIGSKNYSFERVSETIQTFDEIWRPLMTNYYKCFGKSIVDYDNSIKETTMFFKERYDNIVQFAESDDNLIK